MSNTGEGRDVMETGNCFQIRDWSRLYENSRSESIGVCNWVPLPNKQDGLGYTRLVATHDNGMAHYGVWVALVCLCSKQRPPRGGYLTVDGTKSGQPLSLDDMSLITRAPRDLIIEALPRFVEIGWLDESPVEIATALPRNATALPRNATALPSQGNPLPLSRREGKGMEEKRTKKETKTGVSAFFVEVAQTFHSQQKKNFPKESIWSDENLDLDGARELEKYERVNGWTRDEIAHILEWVLNSPEWRPNIRSLRSVRKRGGNGSMKLENAKSWMAKQLASDNGTAFSSPEVLGQVREAIGDAG